MAVNTAFSWLYIHAVHSRQPPSALLLGLWPAFALFALQQVGVEVLQASHQPLGTTLRNPWNWMQFCAIGLQLLLCGMFWISLVSSHLTASLLGLQLTLCYFRIIFMLRGFAVFGPLWRSRDSNLVTAASRIRVCSACGCVASTRALCSTCPFTAHRRFLATS